MYLIRTPEGNAVGVDKGETPTREEFLAYSKQHCADVRHPGYHFCQFLDDEKPQFRSEEEICEKFDEVKPEPSGDPEVSAVSVLRSLKKHAEENGLIIIRGWDATEHHQSVLDAVDRVLKLADTSTTEDV